MQSALVRSVVPLACRATSASRQIHYQTDSSGIHLSETSNSHYMDQRRSTALANEYVPAEVFNERLERLNLKELNGGCLRLVKDDRTGIATIAISNPTRANAISGTMMVELSDIVSDLERWQRGKGLILHGDPEGCHFSAGADLKTAAALNTPHAGTMMCLFMQNVLSRLQRLPLISVAAVDGNAVGGGAEIAVACDFRLMTPAASIQFIQAKMGLSPGWGGGTRLVNIVGPQRALKIMAGAKPLDAHGAVAIALSDDILKGEDDVVTEASEWLGQYTEEPKQVVRAIKGVVTAATLLPLDRALSEEKDLFSSLWQMPANKAAVKRFLTKKEQE